MALLASAAMLASAVDCAGAGAVWDAAPLDVLVAFGAAYTAQRRGEPLLPALWLPEPLPINVQPKPKVMRDCHWGSNKTAN